MTVHGSGGVSVRRRSAAHGCADAHTDVAAPGDGWVDRIDVGIRRDAGVTGDYRADFRPKISVFIVGQGWPRAWWAVKWGEIRRRIYFFWA